MDHQDPYAAAVLPSVLAETIGENQSPNTLYLGTDLKSVHLGKKTPITVVDKEACARHGIPIVRWDGGDWGPAYDDESVLVINVLYNLGTAEHPKNKRKASDLLFDTVISMCARLGLEAERSKPNSNDLIISGRKFSGLYATTQSGSMLLNLSLLVGFDFELTDEILTVPSEKFADKQFDNVRDWLTTLRGELGREISIEEVKSTFIAAFEGYYAVELEEGTLSETEEKKIKSMTEITKTDTWTRLGKRSPVKDYWRPP